MRASELTIGRTFGVTFDHGDDFMTALSEFCQKNNVRQGYIPMFIAGFAEAEIVGTCEKLENPEAPVWTKVHLVNAEAMGGGTIAQDPATGDILPHIHTALGLKERAADGFTSHLLSAKVLFLTEMLVVEVLSPTMTRPKNPNLYDVPLLTFGS
ncbi:PPC domain-containing DNA-binding protein [Nonomuraea longicatena]|uniref:PPC domain-containing protein n=1 Tax=Nonomuraea longicatena TaxID=83682 RepID=A0ABN1QKG4_9ACTN